MSLTDPGRKCKQACTYEIERARNASAASRRAKSATKNTIIKEIWSARPHKVQRSSNAVLDAFDYQSIYNKKSNLKNCDIFRQNHFSRKVRIFVEAAKQKSLIVIQRFGL